MRRFDGRMSSKGGGMKRTNEGMRSISGRKMKADEGMRSISVRKSRSFGRRTNNNGSLRTMVGRMRREDGRTSSKVKINLRVCGVFGK